MTNQNTPPTMAIRNMAIRNRDTQIWPENLAPLQRAELLKQQCHTGGGAKRRPLWGAAKGGALLFFNSLATFCVFFGPSLCMLLATFPV